MRWEKSTYKYVSYLERAVELAREMPAPLAEFGTQVLCSIGPVVL